MVVDVCGKAVMILKNARRIHRVRCLVSICLSLRGRAFGSRLDPGMPRSELPISLGQLLENALVEDQVCDRLSKPGILRLEAPRDVPFPWPAGALPDAAHPPKPLPSPPTPVLRRAR